MPELTEPPGYRHYAIATGSRLVFTAGAVPLDPTGGLVGAGDHEVQTEQVLANLLATLEAAGARADDVVKTTVFVVGEEAEAKKTVWRAVQRSELATAPSTLVGIASLGYEGQLVEIEAVAVMGDAGTSASRSGMRP